VPVAVTVQGLTCSRELLDFRNAGVLQTQDHAVFCGDPYVLLKCEALEITCSRGLLDFRNICILSTQGHVVFGAALRHLRLPLERAQMSVRPEK
jgi:hypothetical protein